KQKLSVGAGFVGAPPAVGQAVQLTIDATGRDVEALGDTVLKTSAAGAVVRLRDVARVDLGTRRENFATRNGKPAALLAVSLQAGKPVADDVRKALSGIEKLPKGVRADAAADLAAARFAVVELRL